MSKQNLYSIKITCVDCNFALLVNDIKFFDFKSGANVNTQLPLNTFLQPGVNSISCKVFASDKAPFLASTAVLKLIIIEESGSANIPAKELNIFSTPSFESSEKKLPTPTYDLVGKFSTTISFNSVLSKGLNFTNTDSIKKEVFDKYINLYNLLKAKNLDAFMEQLKLKCIETASLDGTNLNELKENMRIDYNTYLKNSALELWEFNYGKVFLKIYNNGKLACLEVKNGNQPLCFINKQDQYAIYIPVYFYRNPENNQLEIIR